MMAGPREVAQCAGPRGVFRRQSRKGSGRVRAGRQAGKPASRAFRRRGRADGAPRRIIGDESAIAAGRPWRAYDPWQPFPAARDGAVLDGPAATGQWKRTCGGTAVPKRWICESGRSRRAELGWRRPGRAHQVHELAPGCRTGPIFTMRPSWPPPLVKSVESGRSKTMGLRARCRCLLYRPVVHDLTMPPCSTPGNRRSASSAAFSRHRVHPSRTYRPPKVNPGIPLESRKRRSSLMGRWFNRSRSGSSV